MHACVVHKVSRHQPATCHITLPRHATTASQSSPSQAPPPTHTHTTPSFLTPRTHSAASPPAPGPPHPCPPPAQQRTASPSWWSPSCLHGCGRKCRCKGEDEHGRGQGGGRYRLTTHKACCKSFTARSSHSCCVGPVYKQPRPPALPAHPASPLRQPVPTLLLPVPAPPTCARLPIDDQALALPLPHHRPEGLPSHQKHMGRQAVQRLTRATCSNTAGSTTRSGWCPLTVHEAGARASLLGCQAGSVVFPIVAGWKQYDR